MARNALTRCNVDDLPARIPLGIRRNRVTHALLCGAVLVFSVLSAAVAAGRALEVGSFRNVLNFPTVCFGAIAEIGAASL